MKKIYLTFLGVFISGIACYAQNQIFHLNGGQSWGHVVTLATDNTAGNDDARLLFSYRNKAKQWAVGGLVNTDRFSVWEDCGDGVYGSGFGTERFTVLAGGNVGIGTSDTHGFKLSVNGNIRAQEIKVESGPWPDYVFKPSYDLLPLDQVKSYIEKNQHLPEMPSEQEVAKEGINLGEMNKLLTKKVEELTLYLIEKDKEVKAQQSELKAQAKNALLQAEQIQSQSFTLQLQSKKDQDLESRLSRLEALLAKPAAKN